MSSEINNADTVPLALDSRQKRRAFKVVQKWTNSRIALRTAGLNLSVYGDRRRAGRHLAGSRRLVCWASVGARLQSLLWQSIHSSQGSSTGIPRRHPQGIWLLWSLCPTRDSTLTDMESVSRFLPAPPARPATERRPACFRFCRRTNIIDRARTTMRPCQT